MINDTESTTMGIWPNLACIHLICTMGMFHSHLTFGAIRNLHLRVLVPSISELAAGQTGPAIRQVTVALPGTIAGLDTTHTAVESTRNTGM